MPVDHACALNESKKSPAKQSKRQRFRQELLQRYQDVALPETRRANECQAIGTYFPKQNISMMHHLLNLPVAHNDNRPHMKNIDTPSYPNDLLLVQFDAPNTILIQALASGNSVWVPASSWPLHADAAEAAEAGRLRAFGADAPFDFTFSGSGIEAFFRCPFLLPCFWPLVSVSTLAFQPCHFPTLQLFGEHHLEW